MNVQKYAAKHKAPNIHLTIIINLNRLVKFKYKHAHVVIAGKTLLFQGDTYQHGDNMIEYITEEMKELIAHFLVLGFGIVLGRYAFPYNYKKRSKTDDFFLPKE